mgnify:FL=1
MKPCPAVFAPCSECSGRCSNTITIPDTSFRVTGTARFVLRLIAAGGMVSVATYFALQLASL